MFFCFKFRLLVVVRDPVTRAISDYTQAASKRKEMKSFEELAFLNQTTGQFSYFSDFLFKFVFHRFCIRGKALAYFEPMKKDLSKSRKILSNFEWKTSDKIRVRIKFVLSSKWFAGSVDTTWGPIKIGLYARYLERWLQYFSLSQFLFVSGERLIVDPA